MIFKPKLKGARSKKGYYFTLDAFFASLILVGGLLLISQNLGNEPLTQRIEYLSADMLAVLSELKVSELNNTYVTNVLLPSSGNTDLNLSVLEQIGTYWAANETNLSINLTRYVLGSMMPNHTGIEFEIEGDPLFQKTIADSKSLVVGERMITGIMKGAPITGATSSAYLRHIDDKRTSSFAYFGGFVGQGNISVFLEEIPIDVTTADITKMTLEVDAGAPFTITINGIVCDSFNPTSVNLSPDIWDVTYCNTSITTGINTISINFSGDINESYIAGGFLKVDYKTDEIQQSISIGTKKYGFPGIEGVANLYDAFYIPGTLSNMSVYLHYETLANKTYFSIGSTVVYQGNTTGITSVNLNDSDLISFPVSLNYNDLSNQTIPLRFASYNETFIEIFGSNADVVLITDMSHSMKHEMEDWGDVGRAIPKCTDANLVDPKAARVEVASCLDADVNAIIMNASRANNSNRMWLVDTRYGVYTFNLADLTEPLIDSEISWRYRKNFNPDEGGGRGGGTCLCCSLNQAYEIFETFSNENRTKSVIMMTDGVPTDCCSLGTCNETSIGINDRYWVNDTVCTGDDNACDTNACNSAINNSINSAKRLHDDLNATVYSIGFGPIEDCSNANYTVREIAKAGNGTFIVSGDALTLRDFYYNISHQILAETVQSDQIVVVQGNVSASTLFNDSYINFTYTPNINPPQPNEISVVVQTDQFGRCDPTITIPPGIRVADAKVVSYSDYHWTDTLIIDGINVYNLSDFGSDYVKLGDPYQIQIPTYLLTNGSHSLIIETGDTPINRTGCSDNNTLIYTALVPSATARSGVVENTEGCEWTIQFEDDTTSTKSIPDDYSGAKKCSYTETNYTLLQGAYDPTDAYDIAVYNLLSALDYDSNGKVFVNLEAEDIEIVITTVYSVPYLWGPSLVKAKVSQ